MFANVNDFRKNNFFFSVFGCIPENSPKNILQCLMQCKMKKIESSKLISLKFQSETQTQISQQPGINTTKLPTKKKKKKTIRNPLQSHHKPPQTTIILP
jgi:hypothetical protein